MVINNKLYHYCTWHNILNLIGNTPGIKIGGVYVRILNVQLNG